MSRDRVRAALSAASLANLWLFPTWMALLTYTEENSYVMKQPPGRGNYLAALTDLALLTLILFLLILAVERWRGRARQVVESLFIVLLLVPANSVRDALSTAFPLLKGPLLRVVPGGAVTVFALLLVGLTALAAWRYSHRLYGLAQNLILVLSPAVLVSAGQSLHRAFEPPETFTDKAPAPRVANARKTTARVVWVIFDEVDGRIAFRDRPAGLMLPELDRLKTESVWTDRGESPSTATLSTMPAVTTGEMYRVWAAGRSTLLLRHEGRNDEKEWSQVESVFTRARALGANSAIAGWYHPYCRILGDQVVDCAWESLPSKYSSVGESWAKASVRGLRVVFETSLLSPFGQSLATRTQAENIQRLEARALSMVSSRQIEFCFLHLQPAHAPHAYDRRTGTFTLANSPLAGYVDSLALVDRTLGRLRRAMEQSGVWGNTHLIVTSDHRYRSGKAFDGRPGQGVPLLVHLAGQRRERRVENEVKILGTQSMVLRMLSGEVTEPAQVEEWMRRGGEFSDQRQVAGRPDSERLQRR